ncbi:hypothetical protein HUJ04_004401 [Dendroctonus ponderosae]|nr:hypothetical protein HUJ04_004401 [Dendroctonus ponderosae]KAH1014612.1 hypothetical protein HUJ05_012460 [Dendroctonus ponderosae]
MELLSLWTNLFPSLHWGSFGEIALWLQFKLKILYMYLSNKIDQNGAFEVEVLWGVLGKILNETSPVAIQEKVFSLHYNRTQFYCLQRENLCGSRELLLALGFLIGTTVERDLREKLESNPLPPVNHFAPQPLSADSNDQFEWKKLNERDLEKYRKWLVGHIASNHDMISEYNEQIRKIQTKYDKCLNIKAHNMLTIYEILALKDKEIGAQFLLETERIVCIMGIYQEWTKKEKIFWKWMASVLQEAKKTS